MKKILLVFLTIFFIASLFSIDVSGDQFGIWSSDDNPINMVGDVTIPLGEELIIDAGSEIIAIGNYQITVYGTIQVNGTAVDTVKFHGLDGLYWGGLRLENDNLQSTINYCRISNTDDANDYAVHCINSPILITNSYFDDHRKAIAFSGLASVNPVTMEIRNSRISDCSQNGILINDNSNAIVDSCEILRCGLGTQFRGAIQLGLQSSDHTCSPQITNNWIHHNGKQGIILSNLFGYDGMEPIIFQNIVENNLTGIYFYNASGILDNNIIRNNFIAGDANSGAGIMLYGGIANPVITNNEIYGNFTGFYLMADATANLGNLENASIDDDGMNHIYDNIDESNNTYSIYSQSTAVIYAQNNYWDSFDETEIAETIIDSNDGGGFGTVIFQPIAMPELNPPQALATNIWEEGLELIITEPLPGSSIELSGYNVYIDDVFTVLSEETTVNLTQYLIYGETYNFGVTALYGGEYQSDMINIDVVFLHTSVEEDIENFQSFSCYPNPFNPQTTIVFSLTEKAKISLKIFNAKGALIKTLADADYDKGNYNCVWDGRDSAGKNVTSGIYFYHLTTGKSVKSGKMVLLK